MAFLWTHKSVACWTAAHATTRAKQVLCYRLSPAHILKSAQLQFLNWVPLFLAFVEIIHSKNQARNCWIVWDVVWSSWIHQSKALKFLSQRAFEAKSVGGSVAELRKSPTSSVCQAMKISWGREAIHVSCLCLRVPSSNDDYDDSDSNDHHHHHHRHHHHCTFDSTMIVAFCNGTIYQQVQVVAVVAVVVVVVLVVDRVRSNRSRSRSRSSSCTNSGTSIVQVIPFSFLYLVEVCFPSDPKFPTPITEWSMTSPASELASTASIKAPVW